MIHNPLSIKLGVISFSEEIERLVNNGEHHSYIEAVMAFCDHNDIDFEDIVKHICEPLRQKIELEAVANGHIIRDQSRPMVTFE